MSLHPPLREQEDGKGKQLPHNRAEGGVKAADFERFFHEEIAIGLGPAGLTERLLKGDRGDREGKYLLLFEFDSVERRDQLFPVAGPGAQTMSDEVIQWLSGAGPALAKWGEYATPFDTI